MIGWGIAYGIVGVLVTLLVRWLDDPYQHFSPWKDWLGAIVIGALWLPGMVYLIGVLLYQHFMED